MVLIECEGGLHYYMDGILKANLEKLKDKIKKDWDFIICLDGSERCLSDDTLIRIKTPTPPGYKDVPIHLLLDKSFNVDTYNFQEDKKEVGNARVIDTGKQVVYEIETEDCRKVQATSRHTFFVKRNDNIIELPLEQLKEGDELVCQSKD